MEFDPLKGNKPDSIVSLREVEELRSKRQISQMEDVFRLAEDDLDERKIVHSSMRDRRVLNVFRDIRTKLIESTNGRGATIMVSSITEGGGATFVSTNIASSIALDHGKTALVVDGNIYSKENSSFENEADRLGFSDFLQDHTVSVEDVVYATGVPRLRFIPIGSSSIEPEYYTSYRMLQFVEELSARYADRFIVIDAPSIGASADPRILIDLCDYVILVVPYANVTSGQIKTAIENFPKEKILGAVFNSH